MRIAVFCASSTSVANEALQLGFDLGAAIAQSGHELVWGGGAISVMGEVARGARSVGGHTIGVIPQRLERVEFVDNSAGEMHIVADMRARKGKIEEISDAFVALPGGLGTLEELFEIWVGRYLGFHSKPIAILDPTGVYKSLRSALADLEAQRYLKPGQQEQVRWCTTIPETMEHLGDQDAK